MMDGALRLALTSSLKEVISTFKPPQAILNTNPMFNSGVGFALDQLKMHMPYFTVVTDFADVHALWFSNEPDVYFLASDWVRVRALENEMKPKTDCKWHPGRPDLRRTCGKQSQVAQKAEN